MKKLSFPVLFAHTVLWLLFLMLPVIFIAEDRELTNMIRLVASPFYWLFAASFVLLFYLNTYVLVPQFLLKKKYVTYGLIAFLMLTGIHVLKPFDRLMDFNRLKYGPPARIADPPKNADLPPPGPEAFSGPPSKPGGSGLRHLDIVSYFIFFMILGFGAAIQLARQWQRTENRAAKADAEKANAELAFLKAQINPHFLFNTLNNIYSLAVIKSDNTPEAVLKLSNIMRYATEDATLDLVPLEIEVACIRDFIDLHQLRVGQNVKVDFSVSGNLEQKNIAPFLLITFVENCFKYGLSKREPAFITIKIEGRERTISFSCQNKIFDGKANGSRTGIGLENTRKRLEHVYPGRHLLDISTDAGLYSVQLTLKV